MNAATGMDMMEAEPSNAAAAAATTSLEDDSPRGLLTMARQLVEQGKPSQALQAVVLAVRAKGGDGAVLQILQRARELYINKMQVSSEADQLASLFAEFAIAETQPARSEPHSSPLPHSPIQNNLFSSVPEPDECKPPILAEMGRKQIMLDAFSDGSSFICLRCGGLVSINRKDEHCAYWCQS